ncbi:MAG: hypothetical protein AAGG01_16160 [Planctomycetota bacterium]
MSWEAQRPIRLTHGKSNGPSAAPEDQQIRPPVLVKVDGGTLRGSTQRAREGAPIVEGLLSDADLRQQVRQRGLLTA